MEVCARVSADAAGDGRCRVETGGERQRRIDWQSEQRIELNRCGASGRLGGRRFVLRLRQCQLTLQDLEPRRAADVESRLRRVSRPCGELPQFVENAEAEIRNQPREIGAPNLGSDIDDGLRQLGFADLKRRLRNGDAAGAFAAELESAARSRKTPSVFPFRSRRALQDSAARDATPMPARSTARRRRAAAIVGFALSARSNAASSVSGEGTGS